jgi:hypothetical protein
MRRRQATGGIRPTVEVRDREGSDATRDALRKLSDRLA